MIFAFSSLHPDLKGNLQICSGRSFVWSIVNYFMVIKFGLIRIGLDIFLLNYLKTVFLGQRTINFAL